MIYYAIYSYLTDSTNISHISSCLFLWLILFWGIGYFVETVSGSISNVTTLKCFLPRLNPSKLQYSSYSAYYSVNQITEKANGLWHKMRTTCYIKKNLAIKLQNIFGSERLSWAMFLDSWVTNHDQCQIYPLCLAEIKTVHYRLPVHSNSDGLSVWSTLWSSSA